MRDFGHETRIRQWWQKYRVAQLMGLSLTGPRVALRDFIRDYRQWKARVTPCN